MSAQSQQPDECHFFRLPRELRDEIYELVLFTEPLAIEQPNGKFARWVGQRVRLKDENPYAIQYPPPIAHKTPSLLAACKQIRTEASKLYYAKTQFFFHQYGFSRSWLVTLGPQIRSAIRPVHLGSSGPWGSAGNTWGDVHALFARRGIDAMEALAALTVWAKDWDDVKDVMEPDKVQAKVKIQKRMRKKRGLVHFR